MDSPGTRSAAGTRPAPARPVALTVLGGPDKGLRFELSRGSALVGTQAGCDLRLSDPTVSRQHLRVELSQEGVLLTDLGSRNGALFAGLHVKQGTVPLGATFRLGDTELRIDALALALEVPPERTELHGLVGQGAAMREVISHLAKVAPSDTTVLLQGETGTGKEVAARALHVASGRAGPFLVFDCAAASPELVASQLFGHEQGAFTGAAHPHPGLMEAAEGGTLFLDELGELPLALQASLLRVLETKEVTRLGAARGRTLDVRFVCATHRDLSHEAAQGRFRADLLFRLAVVTVTLPPLRERLEDIPLLAAKVLADAKRELPLDESLVRILRSYVWPGNVRELKNILLRAAALGAPPELPGLASQGMNLAGASLPMDYRGAREAVLERFEREYVLHLLAQHEGNVSRAAKTAGVARGHLYRLLKRHGLV